MPLKPDLTKVCKDFTAVDALNMKVKNKTIFGLRPNGLEKLLPLKCLLVLSHPPAGQESGWIRLLNHPTKSSKNRNGTSTGKFIRDLTARENAELCRLLWDASGP